MASLKKNLSFSVKAARSELSSIWSSHLSAYQPVLNFNAKQAESYFKNELQQIIKDIEDVNKNDSDIADKYSNQYYSDEIRQRLRETRLGNTDYSLLHLAAKNLRKRFCLYLMHEIKIDKDIQCKSKSTPLHYLIKSNVFYKSDYEQSNPNKFLISKQQLFKETFQVFIEKNCDKNAQDDIGYTPLHYAVIKNNFGAVKLLLNVPGTDLNIEDKKYFTPLHIACKYGNDDVADLLIDRLDAEKLLNVLMFDHGSSLPLHLACRNKTEKFHLVKRILEKLRNSHRTVNYLDAVLKKEDNSKQSILHLAVENNHLNIVEFLFLHYNISKDLKEDHNGNLPIHLAAKNGSIEMFSILQKYDAISFKANNNLENALHIAALYNRRKFITELLNYERFLMNKHESDKFIQCMCVCDLDNSYVPCIKAKDSKQYTALLTALAALNQSCAEELLADENVDLSSRDKDGNSIYHICTEFDNSVSLKYLLENYSTELVYSKNNFEDTILHCACRNGNLEMVKLILNKLYESNVSIESIIFGKNKDGQTCFHIACIKGHFNIIEYLLKDIKFNVFLEHIDNNSNTALHLATLNSHSSIVSLLIDHGADLNAKNENNLTALDLSCRKGYFEISKLLIGNYSAISQNEKLGEYPLHVACYEGAHEVVKLLLLKGAHIDKLNAENKNCLDIAIKRGHREVIRVLLNDPGWHKLIRINNMEESDDETLKVITHQSESDTEAPTTRLSATTNTTGNSTKFIENPQLVALFENKMWDMFKLILDKCVRENEIDFTKIDPPVRSISKHPLMLIARSGQENLLKHETIRMLLQLKWRVIPRFAFYFNLIIYILFMLLFSLYTIELSRFGGTLTNTFINLSNATTLDNSSFDKLKLKLYKNPSSNQTNTTGLHILLFVLLMLQLIKELGQIFFLDGLSYFLSLQNFIEIFTYSTALGSLLAKSYYAQCAYASIAVLFAFILFPLFIQKLRVFGLYVVAFRRTLANSAKFFPIFLIMFAGFILSFNIRTNFGVSYFNSTGYSIIRTLTMVAGELETSRMGLYSGSLPNYIIYFMFIGLMCTIVLNLFVGIAVGEIKTVLDEADIQQTSMRIMFVLKVQSAINPLGQNRFFKNVLNMNFRKYSLEQENRLIRIVDKAFRKVIVIFSSKEQRINLSDPQKRLEDSFNEMSRVTSEQIKSIKFGFSNQITDVESKLFNSQRRLQDSLIEFSNNTNEKIVKFKEEAKSSNYKIKQDLNYAQKQLEDAVQNSVKRTAEEFVYTNKYFNSQLTDCETRLSAQNGKLQNVLIDISKKAIFQFESVKECNLSQAANLRSTILNTQKVIDDSIMEMERNNRAQLNMLETNLTYMLENLEMKFMNNNNELKSLINNLTIETSAQFNQVKNCGNEQVKMLNLMTKGLSKLVSETVGESRVRSEQLFGDVLSKANFLDQKLSSVQAQIDQIAEAVLKVSHSIVGLNDRIEQSSSPF